MNEHTVEVPVHLVAEDDDPRLCLPFVDLACGGVRLRALLDSGARRTRVPLRAEFHESWSASTQTSHGGTVLGALEDRTVSLALAFDGYDLGEIEVGVAAAPESRTLLGQDVLGRFHCEYRLAEGRLVLNGSTPAYLPVHLGAGGHVLLELTWPDGTSGTFVFDTGASISVVDSSFVAAHPRLFELSGVSTGSDASGTSAQTPAALMEGPSILGHGFPGSPVAVVDLPGLDGVVGWPLISLAAWTIDHTARGAACVPCGR